MIVLECREINERVLMLDSADKLKVTDEELMLKSIEGNKKAFYTLVSRWNKQIINYFYKSVSDKETAEDLAQEVFISVWKCKNYNPKAPFYSWLYKIARNKLIDYHRKKKHETVSIENNPEFILIESENHQKTEDMLIQKDEEKMVANTINQLTEEQKSVLILSKYQKLPYEDIAEILNCSPETVKVRVFRAVKSFVKKFKELYENER
jgi:RNA polymerase sigma-70 factor (ECF subfamily)